MVLVSIISVINAAKIKKKYRRLAYYNIAETKINKTKGMKLSIAARLNVKAKHKIHTNGDPHKPRGSPPTFTWITRCWLHDALTCCQGYVNTALYLLKPPTLEEWARIPRDGENDFMNFRDNINPLTYTIE